MSQVRMAGQGFFLGRYAVHFHLVGSVRGSYVKKCAIHHSFNRAVAIHAVDHLQVLNNVVYDIRGMSFFTEDGVERFTVMEDNLAVLTRSLWSLLVVDQTPAQYWFTNGQSYIRRNAAAGSSHFGFWFRPLDHPDGLSETKKYCPDEAPLGAFVDNVAHTTGKYSLKIQDWTPRVNGYYCGSATPQQAVLDGLVGYKNTMAGIWASCTDGDECSTLSHITFNRFTFLDARHTAIESWLFGPGMLVSNSLMVGRSANSALLVKGTRVAARRIKVGSQHPDNLVLDTQDPANTNCNWNDATPRVYGCGTDEKMMWKGSA